jgi:hypothetical protein
LTAFLGSCSQTLDVRDRSNRYNPGGVDSVERPVVMCLDVLEISRILERRVVPIQFLHPAGNVVSVEALITTSETTNEWIAG